MQRHRIREDNTNKNESIECFQIVDDIKHCYA